MYGVVGLKDLRNQLAHQRRVIHYKHSDRFGRGCHCRAPAAAAAVRSPSARKRPDGSIVVSADVKRSTTAGRFTIRTTLPSPRIEAPLTRSVAIVWSSNALITKIGRAHV